MHHFTFSLIVPTLNRSSEVRALLLSLEQQTYIDFEIIIIDQNSDNRLDQIIAEFVDRLHITHQQTNVYGASRARNAGIRLAQGQVLTFPDDDCEYPPDLLEQVNNLLEDSPNIDGISVSTRARENNRGIARLSTKTGLITKYNILKRVIEFGIFIKKSSQQDLFFDEELGVGADTPWWSDEGPDFILQLMQRGKTFLYVPNLFIYHHDPVALYDDKAILRSYRYGCGRGKFLRKNKYYFCFVLYVWLLYVGGVGLSLIQLNFPKVKYYLSGLRGRVKGYINV